MVTVVGNRSFGQVDAVLTERASKLALALEVDLLGVKFSGSGPDAFFEGVTTTPEVDAPEIADAVLDRLQASGETRVSFPGSAAAQSPGRWAGQSTIHSR